MSLLIITRTSLPGMVQFRIYVYMYIFIGIDIIIYNTLYTPTPKCITGRCVEYVHDPFMHYIT